MTIGGSVKCHKNEINMWIRFQEREIFPGTAKHPVLKSPLARRVYVQGIVLALWLPLKPHYELTM